MTPQSIRQELDAEIFGQDKAKEVLSFAFYLHLLRKQNASENQPKALPKSNVLILGNTGSGKRLMINVFTKNHEVPSMKIDSNVFLSGQNFNEIADAYLRFLIAQHGIDKAKSAIIVFEDFDKICIKVNGNNNLELQDEFLALIEQEDRLIQVEQDKPPILFPINNLMFIFSGKFSGIDSLIYMRKRIDNKQDEIIKKKEERLALIEKFRNITATEISDNGKPLESIGFKNASTKIADDEKKVAEIKNAVNKLYNDLKEDELEQLVESAFQKELLQDMKTDLEEDSKIIEQVAYEDLLNYGVTPELVSRIGFIAPFESLSEKEIVQILTRTSGNIINQYKQYFAMHGNTLELKEQVITMLAKEVEKRGVGTRSINTILINLLDAFLYDSPHNKGKTYIVDEAYFKQRMQIIE
jgi:ATP-dependent protease Clp ATPase subunit